MHSVLQMLQRPDESHIKVRVLVGLRGFSSRNLVFYDLVLNNVNPHIELCHLKDHLDFSEVVVVSRHLLRAALHMEKPVDVGSFRRHARTTADRILAARCTKPDPRVLFGET